MKKAKANLPNANTTYRHITFEDYLESKTEDNKYNLVFSANAIHHLDFVRKTELFTKIYKELQFGGIFLNIDPVHPNSAYSEEIQFEIWRNWMNETLEKNGHKNDIGKYDNIPSVYKNNLENKPGNLWDQMQILRNGDEITSATMHHSFRPPLPDLKSQKPQNSLLFLQLL